jgi:hypothetical protein
VRGFGSLLADLAASCLTPSPPAGPALPGFRLVTTPPLSGAKPSTCPVSATASGVRGQQPARRNPKSQVNGHPRRSPGGFGVA